VSICQKALPSLLLPVPPFDFPPCMCHIYSRFFFSLVIFVEFFPIVFSLVLQAKPLSDQSGIRAYPTTPRKGASQTTLLTLITDSPIYSFPLASSPYLRPRCKKESSYFLQLIGFPSLLQSARRATHLLFSPPLFEDPAPCLSFSCSLLITETVTDFFLPLIEAM